jgi:hypothetical protein
VEVDGGNRALIKDVSQAWEERLRGLFDSSFRRYVRILHGPPSKDRVGGKMPLVSIHLVDIHLTEHARATARGRKPQPGSGDLRGLRLDYQFSAWTDDPLDEQLLLDKIRNNVDLERRLHVESHEKPPLDLQISTKQGLKLESSISFWSTMGWPPKVSLQYSVKVP